MVQFTATIKRFGSQGEKTGWTYFEVPPDLVQKLKPGNRKEFKVKGKLDAYSFKSRAACAIAVIPFIKTNARKRIF